MARTFTTPAPVRVWESQLVRYRSIWRSNVLGAFVQPFLYLLGMGLGVGALVDNGSNSDELLGGLSYFEFLAPALAGDVGDDGVVERGHLARAARLQVGSQLPRRGGDAAHARSDHDRCRDVADDEGVDHRDRRGGGAVPVPGHAHVGSRAGGACSRCSPASPSPAPLTAWTATREVDNSFPTIQRFVIMPLFLFGGAFYPIEQLPDWLQTVAKLTPIWHGVELCRDSVNGRLEWDTTLVHVGYLSLFALVGWLAASRTFAKRLGN